MGWEPVVIFSRNLSKYWPDSRNLLARSSNSFPFSGCQFFNFLDFNRFPSANKVLINRETS